MDLPSYIVRPYVRRGRYKQTKREMQECKRNEAIKKEIEELEFKLKAKRADNGLYD